LTTARKLAQLIIDSRSCLYSQWFAGAENEVSDALSRDFHLTESSLTSLIQSKIPNQVPIGLKISPLPNEIASWLTCMLQNLPFKEQWSKEPTRSKLALGTDTNPTSFPSEYQMTGTSTPSILDRNIASLAPSLTPSEKVDLAIQTIIQPSNQKQSEPPWTAWHRPTSWLTEQIQDLTPIHDLHLFYNTNFEDTM
jgi:hypothetical protein